MTEQLVILKNIIYFISIFFATVFQIVILYYLLSGLCTEDIIIVCYILNIIYILVITVGATDCLSSCATIEDNVSVSTIGSDDQNTEIITV